MLGLEGRTNIICLLTLPLSMHQIERQQHPNLTYNFFAKKDRSWLVVCARMSEPNRNKFLTQSSEGDFGDFVAADFANLAVASDQEFDDV